MSETAAKIYEETLQEQHSRNEARAIRRNVGEARKGIPAAGVRWPFELLQNALDFGPRTGNSSVAIRMNCDQSIVSFEHDGVPFNSSDLAALLSGGSSKDFESQDTTGRFGTGFLVTHVLAERTSLEGLLETPEGYEQFRLLLDRGGDEESILKNLGACTEAIRSANPLSDLDGIASARFEYHIDDSSPLTAGIESLKSALPYLYATRQILGQVELRDEDEITEVWQPGEVTAQEFDDGYVEERGIKFLQAGSEPSEVRIFRFMTSKDASASALVLVGHTAGEWKVVPLARNAFRVYREYPLRGSGFLPTNFVLDGKFDPDEGRFRILMTDKDKELVEDAFAAAVLAVKFAFANRWGDAHLLVQVREPSTAFDPTDIEDKDWWSGQLASFAKRVAKLPIVECSSQMLPAIDPNGPYADFVIPSLSSDSNQSETTVERVWSLAEAASRLLPPKRELAAIWTEIAQGWNSLGVRVNRVGVKDIAEWVKEDADTLGKIRVEGDAKQWMALFLDITGECWLNRSGVDLAVLHDMLPDQNQRLRSPSDLSRDLGIPDSLKDICSDIGLDIRSRLLLRDFQAVADEGAMPHLQYVLDSALPNGISEEDAIERAIESLNVLLPEDQRSDDKPTGAQYGSVRLLHYLWESRQENASSTARRVPLVTVGNSAVRSSPSRMMMAPISCWHESAQPFANAYPPNRVLAGMYAGSPSEDLPNCVGALVNWGIAIADPIYTDTPSELTERRLAELSSLETADITVPNNTEEFSQIALLQPEILLRCRAGIDEARALLGLVLCHVALHDPKWRMERVVRGRRSGEQIEVPVAAALWLADLRIQGWVPLPGEDGKPVPMPANAKTLDGLLDPAWLQNNNAAIELLSRWFGFDQLELRLLGIAPDDEKREELRDGLARLVEFGGADPNLYRTLAKEVEERQRRIRDIDRFRSLGIGVQEAIKSAMEAYKLKLKLVDHGFDYEVNVPEDVFGDVSQKFDVGPYLLEVKATTTGHVRLTPTQAQTASSESNRYVLCVVDLRSIQEEQLGVNWTASMVEPLARVVPDIGSRIEGTYSLVEAARTRPIAVRNESALRYEAPSHVWEAGISITEWVSNISA